MESPGSTLAEAAHRPDVLTAPAVRRRCREEGASSSRPVAPAERETLDGAPPKTPVVATPRAGAGAGLYSAIEKGSGPLNTFGISRFLIRRLYRLVTRIQVIGADNIPASGGMVAVSNHVGRLDTGLAYSLVDRDDIIMLMAEKYRKVAFSGLLVAAFNGVWVDRFNADLGAVRTCLRRLKNGGVMVIAPEGTRSPTGNLQRAQSGAGYLAAKAGVPIVPTAIQGTEDAAVRARLKRLRRANVVVTFGQPFRLLPRPDLEGRAKLEAVDDEIMCRIAALLPAHRRGAYADHPRLRELLSDS